MAFESSEFVHWFRSASPYIHAHRGQTVVVCMGGESVIEASFHNLVHDLALLSGLGLRLVVVFGVRPQIEERLNRLGVQLRYAHGLRITDDAALACVKEAAGAVRVEIEAQFSLGLANSPMAGARVRVASGNFVTARPLGVIDGVDYLHTGQVRRVDGTAIQARLDAGDIVLIPPIGYSPTGEVFNLGMHGVAAAVASEIRAGKLVFLIDGHGVMDETGELIRELTQTEALQRLAASREDPRFEVLPALQHAVQACRNGVRRVHLINRRTDGGLLLELFSRDGVGTLISATPFDRMRQATIDDVGGILELIAPLEQEGVLVRRSREKLEMEIAQFTVLERDGAVIACAALYPYPAEKVAELACLAVHPDYRRHGYGEALFDSLERQCRQRGLERLFVLTTQTAHWFLERGFEASCLEDLPVSRQGLYNYQRNSKVFVKPFRC